MNAFAACVLALVFVALPGLASAAGPKDPQQQCQLQLAEKTVQAKNLDDDRDAKEQRIATLQTQLYMEQQTRKALEKHIDELKKKLDEATKKEEPPAAKAE